MKHHFSTRYVLILLVLLTILLMALPALAAPTVITYTGTIDQNEYDNSLTDDYPVVLNAGSFVLARETCDEVAPNDRPLDPYLQVYDPSSTFVTSSDDGNLPNCNDFSSSCFTFTPSVTGTYTFKAGRAAGSPGPYTLLIVINDPAAACGTDYQPPVVAAELPGGAINDGRVNKFDLAAPYVLYCPPEGIVIYVIGEANIGQVAFTATWAEIAQFPEAPATNTLIKEGGGIQLYRLTTGEFALIGPKDAYGKQYDIVFRSCTSLDTLHGFIYPDQQS